MNISVNQTTYYPISNDRMFAAVLAGNPDLAQKMIETILGIQVDHVVCVNAQQILNFNVDTKSVRFDVYIKDQVGVVYDVEMQASPNDRKWLPKRSRYYGSVIDTENVKEGTPYKEIQNSYIIFICTYDPFNGGLARYTGKVKCEEDESVNLENGITYVYLNANAVRKNVSKEVGALLDYIAGKEGEMTELTESLQREVDRYNEDKHWRHWNMTFEEELNEAREEGIEKGIEKGKKEGKEEMLNNVAFAFDLFREGKSDEEVFQTERFSSMEQVKKIRTMWKKHFDKE